MARFTCKSGVHGSALQGPACPSRAAGGDFFAENNVQGHPVSCSGAVRGARRGVLKCKGHVQHLCLTAGVPLPWTSPRSHLQSKNIVLGDAVGLKGGLLSLWLKAALVHVLAYLAAWRDRSFAHAVHIIQGKPKPSPLASWCKQEITSGQIYSPGFQNPVEMAWNGSCCQVALSRSLLTSADLAAGIWHSQGRGAQQLGAGHQATVNLAFLGGQEEKSHCQCFKELHVPRVGLPALQTADLP